MAAAGFVRHQRLPLGNGARNFKRRCGAFETASPREMCQNKKLSRANCGEKASPAPFPRTFSLSVQHASPQPPILAFPQSLNNVHPTVRIMKPLCIYHRSFTSVDLTCTIRNTLLWVFPMLKLSALRKRRISIERRQQPAAEVTCEEQSVELNGHHQAQKCGFKGRVNSFAARTVSKRKKNERKPDNKSSLEKMRTAVVLTRVLQKETLQLFCLHICKFSVIQR